MASISKVGTALAGTVAHTRREIALNDLRAEDRRSAVLDKRRARQAERWLRRPTGRAGDVRDLRGAVRPYSHRHNTARQVESNPANQVYPRMVTARSGRYGHRRSEPHQRT